MHDERHPADDALAPDVPAGAGSGAGSGPAPSGVERTEPLASRPPLDAVDLAMMQKQATARSAPASRYVALVVIVVFFVVLMLLGVWLAAHVHSSGSGSGAGALPAGRWVFIGASGA